MIHLTHTGYLAGQLLCGSPRTPGNLAHAIYAPLHLPEYLATVCPDCLLEFAKSYLPEDGEPAEEMPQWATDSLRARYDALKVANVHQGDREWREWQELSAFFASLPAGTFAELPNGARFRWLSNLGAGDTLEKTGPDTYRNITTRSKRERFLSESIFTAADPVRIIP